MGNLYAATPGQNPGVARIYILLQVYLIYLYEMGHAFGYNMFDYSPDPQ